MQGMHKRSSSLEHIDDFYQTSVDDCIKINCIMDAAESRSLADFSQRIQKRPLAIHTFSKITDFTPKVLATCYEIKFMVRPSQMYSFTHLHVVTCTCTLYCFS